MKSFWLNKKNNEKIIVFFNGWGMDEKVVSHLKPDNYDVLTFYDYRDFNIDNFDFSLYDSKILIAWSLGVYTANNYYDIFRDFNYFLAVNGTSKPIDDNFGIPKKIYNLTVDNFNELSCKKFMKKISGSTDIHNYCSRSLPELKKELISIRDLEVKNYLKFDKTIVSSDDKIISAKNQLNYWETQDTEIIKINGMHYIFDKYNFWSDLL